MSANTTAPTRGALLACPFCGSSARVCGGVAFDEGSFTVACDNTSCGAELSSSNPFGSADGAIAAWNTRAPITDAEVERAAEALCDTMLADVEFNLAENFSDWKYCNEKGKDVWRTQARAILTAARGGAL